MASLLTRLFGLPRHERDARFDRSRASILPTPDTRPIATPSPSETPAPANNWCHPLKATQNPLEQLTHLANASAGYYPIGRSGLFHGGVHFDSATGVTQDQAVHCLADGEVVAFRVDTHSPNTRYFIDTLTVDKPFARNFVLVRHRLQPPKIQDSTDTPPSLIFYSLYMHLRDWAKYQEDSAIPRPAHWPQSPTLRVKQTVSDVLAGHPEPGLNVRHEDGGKVIDLLPRGAAVTVSGQRNYRKLEDRLAPSRLINADGSVAGYIAASRLQAIEGNQHRITSSEEWVNVRAEPTFGDNVITQLPSGTVVTVSGEGPFRKLERVNQYVHFKSLEQVQEPQAVDQIVALEQPLPIKAGELIGHLGDYQDSGADRPEQKLHLEVFSGDDIDVFFAASRAWAERLPDKDKTWLKLAKGTAVVAHQEQLTGSKLSALRAESPLSAADLLVPKSLLDGLPAERKIHVPGDHDRKARNWYRLDNLLHDADDNLLNGWVCEEVGVTPWLSPWVWDGYEVLYDYSLPKHAMASFFSAVNRFNEPQRERFRNLANIDHQGRMKTRLYDIIDPNRTGNMTADELQTALRLPAKAQAISKLVLRMESEWFYQEQKWDALDELLGHCGSTPHWNWVAEKERIEQMSWWAEVAEKVGLPVWGRPYHFHPVGLVGSFMSHAYEVTVDLIEKVTGKAGPWFTGKGGSRRFAKDFAENYPEIFSFDKYEFISLLNEAFVRYDIITPYQKAHFIAQCFHESAHFETTIEFATGDGYDPGVHAGATVNGNTEIGDGKKYKGKGLIQLTWKNNYKAYSTFKKIDFVSNPDLIAQRMSLAIDVSCWYWRNKGSVYKKHEAKGDINILINKEPFNVTLVTLAVNGGSNGLDERTTIFNSIMKEWGLK
ncbi:TPA: hypothetical protein SAN82_005197 [Pseudomonas putida]|nr:hypothetical protein [Pseudomonas putida]